MNNNVKIYGFADEASPMIDEQIKAMHRNGLAGLEIRNVDGTWIAGVEVDKIKEVGLDVPQTTDLLVELKKCGVELPEGIISVDECISELEKLF